VDAALGAVGLWMAAEWSPFVPVTSRAALLANLVPAHRSLHWWNLLRAQQVAEYACYMAGLLVLSAIIFKGGRHVLPWFAGVAGCVLLFKPLFRYQPFSMEAMIGLAVALLVSPLLLGATRRIRWAMLLLLAGFVLYVLQPSPSPLTDFNLLPFRYQTNLPVDSIPYVLRRLWPFLALGCLAALSTKRGALLREALAGGTVVFLAVLGLEWWQHSIQVWFGDITTVILAVGGWTVPWLLRAHQDDATRTHAAVEGS